MKTNREHHVVSNQAKRTHAVYLPSATICLFGTKTAVRQLRLEENKKGGGEKKNTTAKEITYMFCRAMDSKRSVMADKDDTGKKRE